MTTHFLRRALALIAALVLLLTVGGGLLAPNAAAVVSISRPEWTPGDYWTYQVELYDGWSLGAVGTMRAEILKKENLTVGTEVYPTYHARTNTTVHSASPGSGSNVTTIVDQWLTMDLAGLRTVTETSTGFSPMTRERTVVPPVDIPWPLSEGMQWNWTMEESITTTIGTYQENTSSFLLRHFEVRPNATLALSSGQFTTLPLRETDIYGAYVDNYWSARVGHWVQSITVRYDGLWISRYQLTDFSYQAGQSAPTHSLDPALVLIGVGIAIVAIALVLLVRRRRPREMSMPGTVPGPGEELSEEESLPPVPPPVGPP
jgi:hypothetical protein